MFVSYLYLTLRVVGGWMPWAVKAVWIGSRCFCDKIFQQTFYFLRRLPEGWDQVCVVLNFSGEQVYSCSLSFV